MERELEIQKFKSLPESYSTLEFMLNKWRAKSLHAAVILKKYEIARILMIGDIGFDKQDKNGNTALHIACMYGNYKMAKILTTPYAAPITAKYLDQLNNAGQSCLHIAACRNRPNLIKLLVNKGASIDVIEAAFGGTPLHTAVVSHSLLAAQFIVKYCKPNLAIENYAGKSMIIIARKIVGHSVAHKCKKNCHTRIMN